MGGNKLVLFGAEGSLQVWLSTFSQDNQLKLVVAELLENGNFILKDAYNRTCSESFDFPGDTILPGMIWKKIAIFFFEKPR
ncbi:unnamed protein product [Brassica oleracea var. botrytis]|uniref:(rape) hypothetical protein n=1 Tax=Brassica napus TaxID=3708 RepID=A0A816MDC2_BRANA|nr:unnamed protein product [Brassica napus]